MAAPYYTVDLNRGETRQTELEIKRSRFITQVRRVETEPAARELIAEARSQFFDARHHCSAFALGPRAEITRSSDDGEPAGTAGAPMLNALTQSETCDVVAVVSRYFGGIKLGAAGLTRAYGEAVSGAILAVGRRRVSPATTVEVAVPLELGGKVETWLRQVCLRTVHRFSWPRRLGERRCN